MQLLLSYIRPYRKLLVLSLLLATINQVFSLLDPQIFRLIVDRYVTRFDELAPQEFISGVGLLVAAFIGVAMVSRVAKNFQDYYVNVITQNVGTNLYADGVSQILQLPFQSFEDQRSGETLQQLEKARSDSQELIQTFVNMLFLSVITLLVVIGYSLWVHWAIAVTLVLMFPLLGSFLTVISRRIRAVQDQIFREGAGLAGSTTESLRNIELIKSLGLESQEINRLNDSNSAILRLELRKVKTIRMLSFVQGTAINFLRACLIMLLLALVYFRQITIGEFFTMLMYSFFIFAPLSSLGMIITRYQEARSSLQQFEKLMQRQPEQRNPRGRLPRTLDRIAFDQVSFVHASAADAALTEVSFEVRAGQTLALVGPSGAGKSTAVKLLLGLYRPGAGRIVYGEVDGGELDWDALRGRVGFVPQSIELFAGTIRDNLRFVNPSANDAECRQVLQQARLHDTLERAADGLDTRIGEGGMKLSGGERQRLAIARALLRRPDILIFDEATSSLDTATEREISTTIEQVVAEHPHFITLMIAHRLSTIAHADRIVVLERGRVVEHGTHEQLLTQAGLYHALWREQVAARGTGTGTADRAGAAERAMAGR